LDSDQNGCADRSAYDLTCVKNWGVSEYLNTEKIVETLELSIRKSLGQKFGKMESCYCFIRGSFRLEKLEGFFKAC
jgi:hypothetical protein